MNIELFALQIFINMYVDRMPKTQFFILFVGSIECVLDDLLQPI